jgi:hypothetical protein
MLKIFLRGIMRLLFLLSVLCSQGALICRERPTHLKALITYDSSTSGLQKYYQIDSIRMKKNISAISFQTGLTPDILVLQSNQLTTNKLKAWIKGLSDKDVAIFYYAGKDVYAHEDTWPSVTFRGKKRILLPQRTLARAIKQKHAYLTLVLIDCYSKVLKMPRKSFSVDGTVPMQKISESSGLASLFIKNPGFVIACSTRRGKPGFATYRNEPIGGLFTTIVQNYFNDMCHAVTPFWGDLSHQLKFFCAKLSHKQQRPFMYKNARDPDLGKPTRK